LKVHRSEALGRLIRIADPVFALCEYIATATAISGIAPTIIATAVSTLRRQ
jgi:hypothetical protein